MQTKSRPISSVCNDATEEVLISSEHRLRKPPRLVEADGTSPALFYASMEEHVMQFRHLPSASLRFVQNAYVYNDVVFTYDGERLIPFDGTWRSIDQPSRGGGFLQRAETLFHSDRSFDIIDKGFYIGSAGSYNYGHWLVDDLPRLHLAGDFVRDALVVFSSFGKKIDAVKEESIATVLDRATCCTIDPSSFTLIFSASFADPISFHPLLKSTLALSSLRNCAVSNTKPGSKRKLFVTRSEHRSILNNCEVENFLTAQGFTVISPEKMSFREQVSCFSGSEMVIGIMGAAMTNIIFCDVGTHVCFLAPHGWEEPFYWDLCDTIGLEYVCYYGSVQNQSIAAEARSFLVEIDGLAKLLSSLKMI